MYTNYKIGFLIGKSFLFASWCWYIFLYNYLLTKYIFSYILYLSSQRRSLLNIYTKRKQQYSIEVRLGFYSNQQTLPIEYLVYFLPLLLCTYYLNPAYFFQMERNVLIKTLILHFLNLTTTLLIHSFSNMLTLSHNRTSFINSTIYNSISNVRYSLNCVNRSEYIRSADSIWDCSYRDSLSSDFFRWEQEKEYFLT